MIMFNERHEAKTTLKVRETHIPKVFISDTAINKMAIYTKEAPGNDEIGWLGTAYREGNEFLIKDVFLFEQEVHGTTTEITPEGLAEFANELLTLQDGVEIWNNLKMWGHSHVNMGISPSGQDDSQMEAFSKIGHDFFIRLICNKKGELAVDVYLYDEGLEFHNAPWESYQDQVDEVANSLDAQLAVLKEQLEGIQKQMGDYRQSKLDSITEPIKAEIRAKVRKLVYKTNHAKNNTYKDYEPPEYKQAYNSTVNAYYNAQNDVLNRANYAQIDVIDGVKNNISDFYSPHDLTLLANTCHTMADFLEDATLDGMNEMLSFDDLSRVWEAIMDIQDQTWDAQGNAYY